MFIGLDKRGYQVNIFFFFIHKNICCGYSLKSSHNICFCGIIGKISILLNLKKHLIKRYDIDNFSIYSSTTCYGYSFTHVLS